MSLRPLVIGLCICASLSAAEESLRFRKLKISAPPAQTAQAGTRVEFYHTADGGETWHLVASDAIKRPADAPPYYIFNAPGDGVYGFYTRVIPPSGPSQAAPRPGMTPATIYRIDTTPPTLLGFSSWISESADQSVLTAHWAVADDDARITLQASADDERWYDVARDLAATGHFTDPMPSGITLRLVASDAAGNTMTSSSQRPMTLPAPLAPTPTRPASQAAPETLTATAETVATRAPAPSPAAAAAAPAQEPIPAAAAPAQDPQPAAPAAPPAPDPRTLLAAIDPHSRRPHPSQTAPGSAELAAIEGLLAQRSGRLLLDQDATRVLAAARGASANGNPTIARRLYARLVNSTLPTPAFTEGALLELRAGLPHRALALIDQAPPEAQIPELSLIKAYALFASDPQAALHALARIPPNAACLLEAQILRARCLLTQSPAADPAQARDLLTRAARQSGHWGRVAQDYLDILHPQPAETGPARQPGTSGE